MRATNTTVLFVAAMAMAASPLFAQQPTNGQKPIRGAHYPALSPDGKRLCFEYLGDLWTVSSSGGTAARLTTHQAYDAHPRWSPDGNWIAFSSSRDGNLDIHLVPARGGPTKQVTYHSADDFVCDWSPDGTQILFQAARDGRFQDLYTLSLKDNRVRRLTNDRSGSRYGAFAPNGAAVAYARGGQEWWRPKYSGSRSSELYTVAVAGGKTLRVTNNAIFDNWPLYAPDGALYFVSQRDGSSDLYRLPAASREPARLTTGEGDPVRFPSIARDGSAIVYEAGFDLHLLPLRPAPGARPLRTQRLTIYAPSDQLTNWKQRVTMTSGATSIALSGDGKSMALAVRGEIWTIPTDKGGDATRLTKTTAQESSLAWSPDGTKIAYTTDRAGSVDIYLLDVKTKVEKPIAADPANEVSPQFSPDGRFLSFVRTGGGEPGLYVVPFGRDYEVKPADIVRVGPGSAVSSYDWSPDGRWVSYSRRDATGTSDIWIVPSVGGTPVNVTRYPGTNSNPRWTRDGRHLVFTSNRGGVGAAVASNLYAVQLMPPVDDSGGPPTAGRGDTPPVDARLTVQGQWQGPESQRRPQAPPGGGAQAAQGGPPVGGLPPVQVPPRATNVRIEFDGIHDRARQLTNTRDGLSFAALSPDARSALVAMQVAGQTDWWIVDIVSGATMRISGGAPIGSDVEFAPDAARFYYLAPGGTISQLARQTPAPTTLAFSAYMEIDRRAEIAHAFSQAWRELRTQFYDPQMHGVDWQALRSRYEPLVDEIYSKEDFAYLLQSMIGELNASHLGATPPAGPGPTVTTGYLGLDFDPDYAGPGLKVKSVLRKGPTDQAGRRVDVGQYLLSIDGTDVRNDEEMHRALEDRVGKSIEVVVGDKPSKEGARTLKVRPIAKSAVEDLAYEQWVDERREKVDVLSGGRLAYMHVRAMDQPSLRKFERELFGYAQSKQGLVLDVRFNGGGRIHDDLLALLVRKPHVYETPRDGERATQPFQAWARPTILLINEYSASDAEVFPNGFRQNGLGKLVGVPTAGAVIGTTNITLIDGTTFRVPRTGWTTLSGKNLENWGVPPDVKVEMEPEDYAADNDKQIEVAVREILKEMDSKGNG